MTWGFIVDTPTDVLHDSAAWAGHLPSGDRMIPTPPPARPSSGGRRSGASRTPGIHHQNPRTRHRRCGVAPHPRRLEHRHITPESAQRQTWR